MPGVSRTLMIDLNESVYKAKQACQLCHTPNASMSRWKVGRASAQPLMSTQ